MTAKPPLPAAASLRALGTAYAHYHDKAGKFARRVAPGAMAGRTKPATPLTKARRPPTYRFVLVLVALGLAGPAAARPPHHSASPPPAAAQESSSEYYINVSGHRVHRPEHAARQPAGATARCRDGTWSFSQHHRGTCSHHDGVRSWL